MSKIENLIDDGESIIINGVHNYSSEKSYVEPSAIIKNKLEEFKDMKLGFMVHWGLYNQLGMLASWGLVDKEKEWSRADCEHGDSPNLYDDGKKIRDEYFSLKKSFNPVRFNPSEWAELASNNCFKYLIFTTKHHDGFCMFDTKQTNFKVTDKECPYSNSERADIVKQVFNAFREKGIKIGAYFSKPDWHNDDYWETDFNGETSRMPTYDITKRPEKWQAFTDYVHTQMEELVKDYGKIDILWLDGGQVCKKHGLDIQMEKIVPRLREINPELIVADRTAGGEFENYITPEMMIPDNVINVPWESCLTIGKSFHYVYDDDYKSPEELIELLLEIVCKGGNLALNVSPQPDGRMPRNAIKVLNDFGNWLKKYGESIFETRPCAPYKKNGVFFTQTKESVYATAKNFNANFIPCEQDISKVEFLGTGCAIDFEKVEGGIVLKTKFSTDEIYSVFKLHKA